MRALLDTHALLWWLVGSQRLSPTAKQAISDEANEVLISAASAWEVATKYHLGRLPAAEAVALNFAGTISDQGLDELAITVGVAALPGPLRDPFDRMLIAQALARSLVLISIEECFDPCGVSRLW